MECRTVVVLHLDLGIGGAEKLIVNLASMAQNLKYKVRVITSHHDEERCFDETKKTGNLGGSISVYGDFLPRNIFGKCTALCAIIRMLYATSAFILSSNRSDLVLTDGVSVPVVLLQLFGFPVVFYCHYPDKLLVQNRNSMSIWKKLYRKTLDLMEELSTGSANTILVNSQFTAKQFKKAFESLGSTYSPKVLYPTVKDMPPNPELISEEVVSYTKGFGFIFVSLNRFERKKDLLLAVEALDELSRRGALNDVLLVIAGGYDIRVEENVSYFEEIKKSVESKGLNNNVVMRKSISTEESIKLLHVATAILYTPDNEHFGIVPIEAMQLGTPVIAVASGGPLETVKDQVTGLLCEKTSGSFADAMELFIVNPNLSKTLGENARAHVKTNFTDSVVQEQFGVYLRQTGEHCDSPRVHSFVLRFCIWLFILTVPFVFILALIYVKLR